MSNLNIFLKNSPNFSKKIRPNKDIKVIVIHYTGMQSEVEAINKLLNPKSKVSCHYFIKQNGQILNMVGDKHIAWHAGKSKWKNLSSLNNTSIGIELANLGHDFGYEDFKKKQIYILIKLLKKLIKKYNIKNEYIVGHSDISPLRKKDPGEKFPWGKLAKLGIGFWHSLSPKLLTNNRNKIVLKKDRLIFFKYLKKIGFQIRFGIKKIKYEKKLIKAFQRRFRPENISGIIDKESLLIAKKLSNY
jgi:N-acetylmuramoyl-L-alanine amidase